MLNRISILCCVLWVSVGLVKPRIESRLNEKLIDELDEIGEICEGVCF